MNLNISQSSASDWLSHELWIIITCTLAFALKSMIHVNASTSLAMWSLGRARWGSVLTTAPIVFNSIWRSRIICTCLKYNRYYLSRGWFFFTCRNLLIRDALALPTGRGSSQFPETFYGMIIAQFSTELQPFLWLNVNFCSQKLA